MTQMITLTTLISNTPLQTCAVCEGMFPGNIPNEMPQGSQNKNTFYTPGELWHRQIKTIKDVLALRNASEFHSCYKNLVLRVSFILILNVPIL